MWHSCRFICTLELLLAGTVVHINLAHLIGFVILLPFYGALKFFKIPLPRPVLRPCHFIIGRQSPTPTKKTIRALLKLTMYLWSKLSELDVQMSNLVVAALKEVLRREIQGLKIQPVYR